MVTGFVTAPSIAWGPGAVEQLGALGARRALLVVDPAVKGREPEVRALEELGHAGTTVEVETAPTRPQELVSVGALSARLRAFGPDWVVAIGGGATLDGVKAARLWAELPDLPLEPVAALLPFPETPRMRVAAVPTTSGSGAEASWTCDLVAGDGAPVEVAHRGLVPEWALVDPAFAQGLDPNARRDGGLASAATAAEAYLSAWSNPFSDALAVGALTDVVRSLPLALRWTDEPDARASLHYAATLAGLAASNAQRGLAHALARALVRPTGLPYGRLVGLLLPTVLEFDRPGARERLDELARVAPAGPDGARVDLATRLRRLADSLGAPADLRAAGVDPAKLQAEEARIVAETLRSPGASANPRVPGPEEVRELLATLLRPRERAGRAP